MKNVLRFLPVAALALTASPAHSQTAWAVRSSCVTQVPIVAGSPVFTITVVSSIDADGKTSRDVRVGLRTAEELLKPGTKVEGVLIEVEGQREFTGLTGVAGNGNAVTVTVEDTAILGAFARGSAAKVVIPTQAGTVEHSFSLSGSSKAVDRIRRCP